MAVELATAYVNLVPSAKGIGKSIAGELRPLEAAGANAGTKASKSFGSKFAAGMKLATVAAGATLAAGVGAFAGLVSVGNTFDQAFDKIRTGTGQTGLALEGLKGSFRGVVKDVPATFGDASAAIAGLNSRLGLTGKPLRDVADRVLELTRLTGTDLATNIPNITRLFGDWSIKTTNQAETLDKLFRASQTTGIGVDKLSDLMVNFGSPLRQLGFNFNEAAAMFSRFEKEGVNISTVLPGLRFSLKTFAKAGLEPKKALADVIAKIKELGPSAEATKLAFATFGARAGPDLAAAIQEGRFELDKTIAGIKNGKDTILGAAKDTEDFGQKWQRIKNRVFLGLEPIASAAFDAIGKGMDALSPIVDNLGVGFGALGAAFSGEGITSDGFVGFMERIGVSLRAFVQDVFPKVRAAIPAIRDAFLDAAQKILPVVLSIGQNATRVFVNIILPALLEMATFIRTKVVPAVLVVAKAFSKFLGFLADHAGPVQLFAKVTLGLLVLRFAALKVNAAAVGIEKFVQAVRAGNTPTLTAVKNLARLSKAALLGAINIVRQTAAYVAQKVAMIAGAVATKVLAAAQWLLNAAMDANPIGLIVIGIAALVAGVILAYQRFKPFRDIVDAVGRALAGAAKVIVGAALAAFNWIKNHWPLLLAILTGPVGIAVLFIVKNFGKIRSFVTGVWNTLVAATSFAWSAIKSAVLTPIGLIRDVIAFELGVIKTVWDKFWGGLHTVVETAVGVIKGAINGVLGALEAVYNGFRSIWNAIEIDIPKVHIPGTNVDFGGGTLGLPDLPDVKLPRLAAGGVLTQPTLALLAETSRSRPEIAAPEPLLRKIFSEELGKGRGKIADVIELNHIKDPADAVRQLTWAARTRGH